MKKKLCSILLALTMVLTLLPVSALAEEGTPAEAEPENVAQIANEGSEPTKYKTLAEAVAAVADGGTVTLLSDASGCGIIVPEGKQFTLDFGGHTYTVDQSPLAGSSGTQSQCFQLLKNSTLTFKNGTIACNNSGVAMMIQNYANLTLDGMTINGNTMTRTGTYAMSNNNGNVVIKDTTIIAKSGDVAFDVCRYADYPSVNVTVKGNSTINGTVEVSGVIGEGQSRQLNIEGGNFTGNFRIDGAVPANTSITGGTFTDLSALDYLAEGANVTVKLVADTQKDVVIPANTTVTLDLAGHKLTNVSGHTITNDGTLTVTGNGTVDNVTHCKGALYNKSGATAILNGGTFTRSQEAGTYEPYGGNGNSWYTIQNDGTMTINAGTTVTTRLNDSGKAVGGYSSLIRNGGNAGTAPTLLINGGHFNGGINTVKNDAGGTLTIKGGDFSNTTQYVIMNWNIADIYDGTFEANSTASAVLFSASWDGSAGTLNFHGGNVKTTSESQKAIRDYFDASHTGKVAVSGGTFTSDPSAYVAPGYVASYNDGTYTVYYPVPVIPNNNNNSSSTTTTTTDKATGAVTETTTTANGSVGTVKTDANGSTEISASISAADVKAAEQKNAPVIAPITVAPAASSAAAPVIKLSVPANAGEVAVAIPVVNAKQGTVAIKVNPDGTEEIIKTAVVTENGLVLGVKGSMQIKVINNSKNFADTVGHWAASDVDFVSARELFNGTAPALFSPEASMTRGMVVTVIARLAGENTDGGANWYDKGCAWAVANGVSDGTNPNGSITREQLAAMLYRYCGSPAASGSLSAYADAASVSAFGSDAMQWCVNNGIINGMDGLLNPQGQATRAQVSAMFARYIRLAAAK